MTITVRNLFETHVSVADLDASAAFYRDVVGLHLAHVVARQAVFFWIGPRGSAMLGLWAAGPGPQKVTMHLAFHASLEDVLAAPAASVYFRDPDGHLLEYIAMLSDEPCPDRGIVPWRKWQLAS